MWNIFFDVSATWMSILSWIPDNGECWRDLLFAALSSLHIAPEK
jgi:hypothetical protein